MLTDKQQQALAAFRHYVEVHHVSPSVRDLSRILNISPTATYSRLQYLIQAGYIQNNTKQHRGYWLTDKEME